MKKVQTLISQSIYELTLALQNDAVTKEEIVTIFQNNNGEYIAILYK